MDDAVSRCRQQLASFRIRELKDVLARLGLPKQGKKQLLMDKIMAVLAPPEKPAVTHKGIGRTNKNAVSKEECANVIDDIYRKLRGSGAPDLASSGRRQVEAASSSAARSEDADEAANWGEAKTRCPCGNSKDLGVMIQCDDSSCGVWQHMNCVVIPEKSTEGVDPEIPSQFYCELCRINRSDPFCVTLQCPLPSTKLTISGTKSEGANPLQSVEKLFQLNSADRDSSQKQNHDIQVWCVLLNDKVPFRIHWPAYADLRINGASVRVTNRPGQQLLGANGRDEGPGISSYVKEGVNRLELRAYDARPFCVGVRVIQRKSLQQVYAMIPDVTKGEDFEEALVRVRRCIHGGGQGTAEDGDSDSDLEVVADSIFVNLRCPMSGSRIKTAGRFKPCLHMGCFDLNTFVELNQRARKWQCPICLKNYALENLIIDPFVNRVTTALKSHAEDVTEVEMKADGQWRPKGESEKSREPWRFPDGSIVTANGVIKDSRPPPTAPISAVKVEGISSQDKSPLRIGMKRTHDGLWAINGAVKRSNGWAPNSGAGAGPSQKSKSATVPPVIHPAVISRSTSATDSNEENGEDGERSVNQEPSDKEIDIVNLIEDNEESYPPPLRDLVSNRGTTSTTTWQNNNSSNRGVEPPPPPHTVIVLSDTDDDEGDTLALGSSSLPPSSSHLGSNAIAGTGTGAGAGPARPGKLLSLSVEVDDADDPILVNNPQPYAHVNSMVTAKGHTSTENRGIIGGAAAVTPSIVGLPLETNNFWSTSRSRPSTVPFNYFGAPLDQQPASAASVPHSHHHTHPVRPTAVQQQGMTSSGFAPQRTAGENWKFRWSPTRSYSNSDCNGGAGSEGANGVSSPRETQTPLQLFLPPQPARAQVQPPCLPPRMSSLPPEDIDNRSWFSLSLGGSDSNLDPPPKRDIHHRSSQNRGYVLEASTASEVLLDMNTNGSHAAVDARSEVQNSPPYLSPDDSSSPPPHYGRADATLSPIRQQQHTSPRVHRYRHNQFRVDSDSD